MKYLNHYKTFNENYDTEIRETINFSILAEMGIKLRLPLNIDVTEDGDVINTDINKISVEEYFENYEGSLNITYINDIFTIDYYLDDDRFLIDDEYDFDNTCTKENFEEKQSEIIELLDIEI